MKLSLIFVSAVVLVGCSTETDAGPVAGDVDVAGVAGCQELCDVLVGCPGAAPSTIAACTDRCEASPAYWCAGGECAGVHRCDDTPTVCDAMCDLIGGCDQGTLAFCDDSGKLLTFCQVTNACQ